MVRKRIALYGGGGMFALYLTYIVVTAFTPWLDGEVGGVGIAYIVGFFAVVAAFAVTVGYAQWANRREDAAARERG